MFFFEWLSKEKSIDTRHMCSAIFPRIINTIALWLAVGLDHFDARHQNALPQRTWYRITGNNAVHLLRLLQNDNLEGTN